MRTRQEIFLSDDSPSLQTVALAHFHTPTSANKSLCPAIMSADAIDYSRDWPPASLVNPAWIDVCELREEDPQVCLVELSALLIHKEALSARHLIRRSDNLQAFGNLVQAMIMGNTEEYEKELDDLQSRLQQEGLPDYTSEMRVSKASQTSTMSLCSQLSVWATCVEGRRLQAMQNESNNQKSSK
jgi:hypothetical protein